jgi:hypothetical protein
LRPSRVVGPIARCPWLQPLRRPHGERGATAPNVVTFTATEYGYQGPKEIPAGPTVFRFSNQGKELHHLVIVRLDGGMTYDSLLVALKKPGPPPAWAHPVGGPNAAEPVTRYSASSPAQTASLTWPRA